MIINIFLFIAIGHIATDIYLPSLPAIADYFNVAPSIMQSTISIYLFSMAISPLIFGPLSDLIGRKKVATAGMLCAIIATIGCSMAANIYFLVAGRAMQGIAMGAIVVASRAMIPDLYMGKELAKKATYISMLLQVILSIVPAFGGYLQEWLAWRAVFIFVALYLGGILWLSYKTQETVKILVSQEPFSQKLVMMTSSYKKLFNNKAFVFYSLCSVLPMIGLFSYLTTSPFLFQKVLGLSPSKYGMLSLYIGASVLIYGYINTKLIKYFSLQKIIFFGASIIILAGMFLMLFTALGVLSVKSILIPVLFYNCFPIFCMTNATALALTYLDDSYGAARAMVATSQFLAGALGSFIFSMLPVADGFYLALCFMMTGVLILGCLLMGQGVTSTDKLCD